MLRECLRYIWRRYLNLVYHNDKNNTCFDCYNEFLDKCRFSRVSNVEDNEENFKKLLEDELYLTYLIHNCIENDNLGEILEELECYEEE
jgi:hypothetical protein